MRLFLQRKAIVLIFLSTIILFGCGTKSHESSEFFPQESSDSSEAVDEPLKYSPEESSDSSSVANEPNSISLKFTPEEIELLRELSKLTDEEILSIFPTNHHRNDTDDSFFFTDVTS